MDRMQKGIIAANYGFFVIEKLTLSVLKYIVEKRLDSFEYRKKTLYLSFFKLLAYHSRQKSFKG